MPVRRTLARLLSQSRQASTSAAVTAVRNVPRRNRELYAALRGLGDAAAPELISPGRLQLALRGLEMDSPWSRVAVLGLDEETTARRLVRLLLADPLAATQDWETALLDGSLDGSLNGSLDGGFLIRYGDTTESIPDGQLPTVSIPASLLRRANMEILVSSLGVTAAAAAADTDTDTASTLLEPTVSIRPAQAARATLAQYPVHKTLVCARGVRGLLAYSSLLARAHLTHDAASVYGVVQMPVDTSGNSTATTTTTAAHGSSSSSSSNSSNSSNSPVALVDIDQAEAALEAFRQSVQNASVYERGWTRSGVQAVCDWLVPPAAPAAGPRDDATRSLVRSLLDAADRGRGSRAATSSERDTSRQRQQLDRAVSQWAERAHTELRDGLDAGFAGKRWRSLAWWKLFWRVDDVAMLAAELLAQRYLPAAEREMIWLAGRLHLPAAASAHGPASDAAAAAAAAADADAAASWPRTIANSRAQLAATTVPALQAAAQRLVLFSASTTTLASALSALTYMSGTGTAYEASTFAVAGLIWSLRRQQRGWQTARSFWEAELREQGRAALVQTEADLRRRSQSEPRPETELETATQSETVLRAQRALEQLQKELPR